MSADKDFNKLLEKIYAKIENFNSIEEADLFEIKNKIREISAALATPQNDENFEKLSSQLNNIEQNNNSLKSTISELITSSSDMVAKLSTTDESSIIKLQTFLTELAYQVSSIKDELEQTKDRSQKSLLDGFNDLAETLKKFQDELGQKVKNDFEGANLAFTKIVEELTEKITELECQFSNYNNTLTNDLVSSITEIQTNTTNINQHLENITNLQNLALTNAEYEEHQREFELTQEESLTKIKEELSELHEKLSTEIVEILGKISIQEEAELIKSSLEDNSSFIKEEFETIKDYLKEVQDSSIEETSATIKEIKTYLEKYENVDFIDSIEKVDTIYENIIVISKWVSKLDSINENVIDINRKIDEDKENSIDFNDLSDKVDIIYDNISILNEWASKLDKINKEIDLLNTKVDESGERTEDEEDTANKIDIIYENLSLLNNWIVKIDSINEKVSLFDEISNKVDEVNENVSNISTWGFKIEDIRGKLEELSNEFAIITSATKDDTENYIYTLLDIESDFAKLHCLLDNNSKVTEEDLTSIKNQFDILNDDISSISKRTNKLILTSDDANKVFNNHIDRFQHLIEELNDKALAFNPVKQFTLLENKTNTIKKIVASNLTSTQNLNDAFVLLAEWVDATGETITSIKDNLDNLQAQVENVQVQNAEIQNNIANTDMPQLISEVSAKLEAISQEKTELIETTVVEVAKRFNEQESTISSLETKIASLETTLSTFDSKFGSLENKFSAFDNRFNSIEERFNSLETKIEGMLEGINKTEDTSEVKTVLDFIATQVISANENSINNKVLNQKMEIMEHQLSKFEKNIAKLVSYLDED